MPPKWIGAHESAELRRVMPRLEVIGTACQPAYFAVPLLAGKVQRVYVNAGSACRLPVAERHVGNCLAIRIGHIASGALRAQPVGVIEIRRTVGVRRQVMAIGENLSTIPSSSRTQFCNDMPV